MFLKRLSPRTLFSLTASSLPSPYSIFIAQCSTYSPSHPDSRNVSVSVWWDLDSCPVPIGVNAFRVSQAIKTALESSGIGGPVKITSFTDKLELPRTNPWVLSSTGVTPHDTGGDSACESLNKTLKTWASRNPPPAHVFVITADGRSASILRRLSLDNYNILLATKESAPAVLSSDANIIWTWDTLVRRYMNGCKVHSESVAPVLSQDSFWIDVQTFLNSDVGSFIIRESTSR